MCLVGECVHPSHPLLRGSSSPSYPSRKGIWSCLGGCRRHQGAWTFLSWLPELILVEAAGGNALLGHGVKSVLERAWQCSDH